MYDPTSMSHEDFTRAICPSRDTVRGLREVFYENNPFSDPMHPTKGEVDHWHALALTHLRKLVGVDLPAEPNHCLHARALWGQERMLSKKWDRDYPDDTCVRSTNAHCGHSFLPSAEDQAPYLPQGHPTCGLTEGSEGVSGVAKVDIPMSIKWIRIFCSFLQQEGYDGGHVGPFWRRQLFGFSFWDVDPGDADATAAFRGKWSGEKIILPWER